MSDDRKIPLALATFESWVSKALDPRTVNPFLRKRKWSPYPRLSDRMTACLLDGLWAILLLGPFIVQLRPLIYGDTGADAPTSATDVNDYLRQMADSGFLGKLMLENLVIFVVTFPIVLWMWIYASTTPGKWIMRMRIVRDEDLMKPTMRQWCLRYLGYLFLVPGFLWVLFDPKGRAFHDLLAKTLVVRVKHWRIADDGTLPQILPEEIAAAER